MYSKPVGALSPELFTLWEELHDADGGLSGPFLHPAYARAAGQVRDGVEIGVITNQDEVVGFLPYQRSRFGVGGPVGSRLCDVAGAFVKPGVQWSPEALVSGAGLRTLRLPGVPSSMTAFQRFQRGGVAAPVLDLSDGFEAYRQQRIDSGSSMISQIERKGRGLTRDVGPWRFEWQTTDDSVFDTLLAWKAAQRKQTGTPNILDLRWARAFVERLRRIDDEGFGGVLSALWVGDTLAAAHFGIRTRRVLHYWVPAYNHELGRYSPGLLALMELARAAAERGIQRIDLGIGEERYKLRAASGSFDMAVASVSTNTTLRAVNDALDHARVWSRGSKVGALVRAAGRGVTRGSYRVQSALTSSSLLPGSGKAR
jgi:CelD/BcsL family acetyltransferase involved in cellulose biosynthesis